MIANHSNWTAPFYTTNSADTEYFMEDYNLVTMILSALKWRQYNGGIRMITDKIGLAYYEKLGITDIWDLGVILCLGDQGVALNATSLWSIGKIHAFQSQEVPYVMMDMDFIVKEKIEKTWWDNKLVFAHTDPESDIYISKDEMQKYMDPSYKFDPDWNWAVHPYTSCFVYFNDKDYAKYYIDEVKRYTDNLIPSDDRLIFSVFTDQKMPIMCAEKMGIEVKTFMDYATVKKQKRFNHIWMYKDVLQRDDIARSIFCKNLLNRIISEFPERKDMLYNIPAFKKYLDVIS